MRGLQKLIGRFLRQLLRVRVSEQRSDEGAFGRADGSDQPVEMLRGSGEEEGVEERSERIEIEALRVTFVHVVQEKEDQQTLGRSGKEISIAKQQEKSVAHAEMLGRGDVLVELSRDFSQGQTGATALFVEQVQEQVDIGRGERHADQAKKKREE